VTISIKQLPLAGETKCPWHNDHPQGKEFCAAEIFPGNCCPWLYHAIYPYGLGLLYGAKFHWNEHGDCQMCCPAVGGVDLVVQKRPNDGSFDPRIPATMAFVIFAEVVKVGACPHGHKAGDRIVFPTCLMKHYLCPAGFHASFPLLRLPPPACINPAEIRCPDWAETIRYDVRESIVKKG
jgi:uncharacterized repeat protein (TIGR04076 family)